MVALQRIQIANPYILSDNAMSFCPTACGPKFQTKVHDRDTAPLMLMAQDAASSGNAKGYAGAMLAEQDARGR